MVVYGPELWSAVPWLSTAIDLRRQGPPESTYHDQTTGVHIDGLLVRAPFGADSDAILTVTATRGDGNDGGEITLAIGVMRFRSKRDVPSGRVPQEDGA